MTKCASCGTEAENASYCPECGEKIIRETISPETEPSITESSGYETNYDQGSVYASDSGSAYRSDYSGESPAQTSPNPQYTQGSNVTRSDGNGQMIFAVINIVISVLMCCVPFVSLILGIIAAVLASGANKAMTAEEAESKIKTARILNIIALVLIIIPVVVMIIVIAAFISDPDLYAEMSRQVYY